MLDQQTLPLLEEAVRRLTAGFADLPPFVEPVDWDAVHSVLQEVATRMQNNYPYHHPLYAGQMIKPPHPIARLSYALAQWINPNNHALDGGRASSQMEKEAVSDLATALVGWTNHLGHLCGGGTMANLEALWVAGRLQPGKKIVASQQAHYTHARISDVLQLPFQSIPCDAQARMDLNALEDVLRGGEVGTVVATLGTTAAGAVDPLPGLLQLQQQYGFRLHADAAYGGYYSLVDNLCPETQAVFHALPVVDSVVIDPHKHGLQPYGCGCVLFRDPSVGQFYQHDSPYTYFSSDELHLGEISLECSRAGAAAVALWATQRLLPLVRGGVFSQGLAQCRQAALDLSARIKADDRWMLAFEPALDIVIWARRGASASEISRTSRALFAQAATQNLHLAVANFPASLLRHTWPTVEWDQPTVACLRSCLMKPMHRDWVEQIWQILNKTSTLNSTDYTGLIQKPV